MKFCISRTSGYSDSAKKPHELAYLSDCPAWVEEVRTCKTFAEFDEKFSHREGTWQSKGRNHAVISRGIYREVPQSRQDWYIDLADFSELMAFVKNEGEVVIDVENGEMTLEIYDDYR